MKNWRREIKHFMKIAQEIDKTIEELRRICCAEVEKARQQKIDNLSMRKKSFSTVTKLLAQIQDLQDKVNSLNGAKEFYDPETANSSGVSHVPSQLMSIPRFQRFGLPRFLLAACYTEFYRYFRTRFRKSTCSRRTILSTPQEFKELGIVFLRIEAKHYRQNGTSRRSDTKTAPRFARNHAIWNHSHRTEGTFSQNCVMENPRNSITELHFCNFPDSGDFQCWK